MTRPDHLAGVPDRDAVPGAPAPVRSPVPSNAPEHPGAKARPARPDDVDEIMSMVRALADYEQARDQVQATEDSLEAVLFGNTRPTGSGAAFCHVVPAPERSRGGPRLAGFALWFLSTSTWTGRHGIYLEDLYVRPEFRGRGFGQALMCELAGICVDRGYARLEWSVLDWNVPALGFYHALGARVMDEWTVHRLSGVALHRLAHRAGTS